MKIHVHTIVDGHLIFIGPLVPLRKSAHWTAFPQYINIQEEKIDLIKVESRILFQMFRCAMSPTKAFRLLKRNFSLGDCPTTNSPSLGMGEARERSESSSCFLLLMKIFHDPSFKINKSNHIVCWRSIPVIYDLKFME